MIIPMRNKNDRGFLLILTLLYTALITAFLSAFLIIVTSGLRQANRAIESTRAYYVADAGLAQAFTQLRASASFPAAFNVSNASYPVGPNNLNGSYIVRVTTNGATWPTYTLASAACVLQRGQDRSTAKLRANVCQARTDFCFFKGV